MSNEIENENREITDAAESTDANRCEFCNVRVAENLKRCPLCGKYISGEIKEDIPCAYPKVNMRKFNQVSKIKLFESLLVTSSIICIAMNVVTAKYYGNYALKSWWSLYVLLSSVCVWMGVLSPVKNRGIGSRQIWQIAFASILFCLGIDLLITTKVNISLSYILPIALAGGIVAASIVALSVSHDITNILSFIIQIFIIAILYFIPAGILFVKEAEFEFMPTFICGVICICFFVFFFLFRTKEMFIALKKLFRF